MPGVNRYGINKLQDALKPIVEKGLKSILVFGVPENLPKVGLKICIMGMHTGDYY